MRLILCIAALATSALASRESASIWGISEDQKNMADGAASVSATLDKMESLAAKVGPAAKIALTSVERIDNAFDKVGDAKSEITAGIAQMNAALQDTVSFAEAAKGIEEAKAKINEHRDAGVEALHQYRQAVAANFEKASGNAKKIGEESTKLISQMQDAVKKAIDGAKKKGVFYFTDEHIYQLTGFYPNEIEKYWDGDAIISTSSRSEVKGRVFYKVKFNVRTPGWWSVNSDELFAACSALSTYLRRQDGIERDLRPPCNHYNHDRVGGMGQCIHIDHSYFSHCGGGGYWQDNIACGGIPEPKLRYTVGYETLEHNYAHHLVHRNRANSHEWRDALRSSEYEYVMCTGGNSAFRTPPQN